MTTRSLFRISQCVGACDATKRDALSFLCYSESAACLSFLGIWWPRLVWLISGTKKTRIALKEQKKKQNTYAIGLLFAFNIFYKTEIFFVSISDGLLQTSRQLLTFSDLKTSLCDVSRKNLRQNGSGDIQRKEWNHARRRGSAEPMNGQFWKKNVLLNDKEKTSEVLDRKTGTAMYACVLNIIEGNCLPSLILPE